MLFGWAHACLATRHGRMGTAFWEVWIAAPKQLARGFVTIGALASKARGLAGAARKKEENNCACTGFFWRLRGPPSP